MFLITFEGIDGCGKTTQAKKLEKYLRKKFPDKKIYYCHLPWYESYTGRTIKNYLEGRYGDPKSIHPDIISEIYTLNRIELVYSLSQDCDMAIFDRWVESNIAFQGAKEKDENLDSFIDKILDLEYNRMKLPLPNIIFYIDIDPEISLKRIKRKKDLHESLFFQRRVREVYKRFFGSKRAEKYQNIIWIDGSSDEESIFNKIKEKIDVLLR